MSKTGVSKFTDMVTTAVTVGLVSFLFKLGTSDTGPTPEVKAALQAQDEQRKAEMAKDDLAREEAIVKEERRKLAAANSYSV
jgi:hypothetical protein